MSEEDLQGYLAHETFQPRRTLQQPYAKGHMVILGGGAVSHERGTLVEGWGYCYVKLLQVYSLGEGHIAINERIVGTNCQPEMGQKSVT